MEGKEEISEVSNDFFIWGIDDAPYGPVELAVVTDWIKDARVLPDTWIFARRTGAWQQAADIPELKKFFDQQTETVSGAHSRAGITPGSLRRIKILADLNDAQLDHLLDFMELQRVSQWSAVVRQGEQGDAMFLVLSGELRARTMIGRPGDDSGHVYRRGFLRGHVVVRPRTAFGGCHRQCGQHRAADFGGGL